MNGKIYPKNKAEGEAVILHHTAGKELYRDHRYLLDHCAVTVSFAMVL